MNVETLAYVYKWTHLPTLMWYVGSRTAEGCHPEDRYICSSKIVKPMILESKSEWKREIVAIGTPLEMYELETEILQLFDARNDQRSFNKNNNDGICFLDNSGDKNPMFGKNHTVKSKKKMSVSGKGKLRSKEACENISKGHIGVSNGPHSEQTKAKQSVSMKGRPSPKKGISIISEKRYYHNGSISKKFIPGTEPKGFVSGRLIAKRRTRAEIAQVLQ